MNLEFGIVELDILQYDASVTPQDVCINWQESTMQGLLLVVALTKLYLHAVYMYCDSSQRNDPQFRLLSGVAALP